MLLFVKLCILLLLRGFKNRFTDDTAIVITIIYELKIRSVCLKNIFFLKC